MLKGKSFTQLTECERVKIEVLLQQGLSISGIARQLGRPVCTISREVKRNGPVKYGAARAQRCTDKRHRQKRKHVVFDQSMRAFIDRQLRSQRWSPELISVKGKQWRDDFISHEWIYKWIWAMKFSMGRADKKYKRLYRYLKHGRGRRRRGNKRCSRGNIIGRTWIDQRCKAAAKRGQQGHLEADLVMGKGRKAGLLVAIDRKSRKVWIRKLVSKEASYIMTQLKRICNSAGNVRTITLDNDQAFAQHYRLKDRNIDTFFTHPYSSQEKGSVENRIGLIRMFFPKKTDFSMISAKEIRKVQQLLNNRPLRMFKYKSPNEIHIS